MPSHMINSSTHNTLVMLLYGMQLTKLLTYFGVDLTGNKSYSIHHAHKYDRESSSYIGYTYDKACRTYYKVISSQHIYIYFRKTSSNFLPTGYSNPFGISLSMEEAVNPNSDEDIISPSDDPMDVDLGASNLRPVYHCAPATSAFAAIETHL